MHALKLAQCGGIYIYIYEHEAIRRPKSENNIGAPSAPQKWLNRYNSRTGGIKFGPRASQSGIYIQPFEQERCSCASCTCVSNTCRHMHTKKE